jgi:hypothetical protein
MANNWEVFAILQLDHLAWQLDSTTGWPLNSTTYLDYFDRWFLSQISSEADVKPNEPDSGPNRFAFAVRSTPPGPGSGSLSVGGGARTYMLAAPTARLRDAWVAALRGAARRRGVRALQAAGGAWRAEVRGPGPAKAAAAAAAGRVPRSAAG